VQMERRSLQRSGCAGRPGLLGVPAVWLNTIFEKEHTTFAQILLTCIKTGQSALLLQERFSKKRSDWMREGKATKSCWGCRMCYRNGQGDGNVSAWSQAVWVSEYCVKAGCRLLRGDVGEEGSQGVMKDLGWSVLTGDLDFSADLVRQMATFGAGNTSTTSTEEFRQKAAEVERMLREMKERSLGSQEELARREHEEAQKCESGSVAWDGAARTRLGPAVLDAWPGAHGTATHYGHVWRVKLIKQAPPTSFTVVQESPATLHLWFLFPSGEF